MTPVVPEVLVELAQLLLRNAAPGVAEGERASHLGLTAALLGVAAEVWDGAAAKLVDENRALRALLDETGDDPDLRLTALKAENDRLRGRLIDAQTAAEAAGDVARQEAIWAELRESTERRKLSASLV
jgi:hypothetical protein